MKALLRTYRAVLLLREARVLLMCSFFFHIPLLTGGKAPVLRQEPSDSQRKERGEAGREWRRMRPAYLVLSHFPSSCKLSELFPLIYIRTQPSARALRNSLTSFPTHWHTFGHWVDNYHSSSLSGTETAMKTDDVYPLPPAAHKWNRELPDIRVAILHR